MAFRIAQQLARRTSTVRNLYTAASPTSASTRTSLWGESGMYPFLARAWLPLGCRSPVALSR
jgi:hypothetical protein